MAAGMPRTIAHRWLAGKPRRGDAGLRLRSGATLLALTLLLACGADPVWSDDWPQWRGPRRDAVSLETGLLKTWPDGGPPLLWQTSGVGAGYSSVVVSDGLAFTIGRQDAELFAFALHAESGETAWTRKIGETTRNACSTPTVDGDRLYALDPDGELTCLDCASGEIRWQKSFIEDFAGRMMSGRGYGESPLVDGDQLICTPGGPDAALVALNKLTGEVVWKATLPDLGPAGKEGAGFSSVVIMEAAGARQYVQLMGRGVVGVSAADGRYLWGYNAIANDTANIPTPVVHDDLVFAANGYNAGSVLLRVVAGEDRTPGASELMAEPVYVLNGSQFQNHHGGVARVGDQLFGGHGSNNGLPTCLDLKTGRVLWKRRGAGVGSAAVLYADGRLYFRYQNGVVALIEASASEYNLHGTFEIPGAGGDSWAHPAIANGRLFLREQDALWVYDLRAETTTTAPLAEIPQPAGQPDALRGLGMSVSTVDLAETSTASAKTIDGGRSKAMADKLRPLYRYAVADMDDGPDRQPLIVGLSREHFTADGGLKKRALKALTKLRQPLILNLPGTPVSDAGLKQIAGLRRLIGLNLELCGRVNNAGLIHLQPLDDLRVLILAGTSVGPAGVRHLTDLRNLTALDLEVCDGVTDDACEALGELINLRSLNLKKSGFEPTRMTDVGLQSLSTLNHLEVLILSGNSVTDAGLVHLQGMRGLRELNLSLLAITDGGLAHLKPLDRLEQLDLLFSVGFAGPVVTDAGLESLAPLEALTSLNLTGARITDAGLERLKSLKRLTTLRLIRTPVTPRGARMIRAALPACAVIVDGSPADTEQSQPAD